MAAGYLPAPGTEFGPCEEPCEHKDCAATRRDLASICQYCNDPIGTRGFYYVDNNTLVHSVCYSKANQS